MSLKLALGFVVAFLLLGACADAGDAAPARPNVVFIIADQWRAQAFGFAGDPNARTPAARSPVP